MNTTKNCFQLEGVTYHYYSLKALEEEAEINVHRLPYTIRILIEALLRQEGRTGVTADQLYRLTQWASDKKNKGEVPFFPARVLLQDFTGVPALVDLASIRQTVADFGGDPTSINPQIPVDLVIDHSVQVDAFGSHNAMLTNMRMEFYRNQERYEFLRWAEKAFDNYRVVPPATGIVHQVNLEYLATVVRTQPLDENNALIYPDTLVGTDSHTTMINALGVLGWGVGGIEAEASMLGEPSYFPIPEVIGVRLINDLANGATGTDLALKVTQLLRKENVVGKFVEFFGKGLKNLSLADRGTVANMAPEYGATCGYFPVDDETIRYLKLTGRTKQQVALVDCYFKENQLYYQENQIEPAYTQVIELDLSLIEANVAGPKRPQDLIPLSHIKESFQKSLRLKEGSQGFGLTEDDLKKNAQITIDGEQVVMKTGSLAIAAITSCTNTSNPFVMLSAGLVAKKAVEAGLQVPKFVKTSLAPGSKVVTAYLEKAGLMPYLEALGFHLVGYGCTTCIGNSGTLLPAVGEGIEKEKLVVSAVLSGNRNFEGRIHPLVKANYLAAPPLVVLFALAGTVEIDFSAEPIGYRENGQAVYLKDLWPTRKEVETLINKYVTPAIFQTEYQDIFTNNLEWNQIETSENPLYQWGDSTYIAEPPYFNDLPLKLENPTQLTHLAVLGKFGDSVTTDHISPAGSIAPDSPAGRYLLEKGVAVTDFNSYGARRGHHEVMLRGTLANIRIRNQLVPSIEGGVTIYWPTGEQLSIYEAAMRYQAAKQNLIILAGKDYGMGSSRDWAAKGVQLLGVKVILAESFERIHRANLVMMGVLPLQFRLGENADSLGLTGSERYEVALSDEPKIGEEVLVTATNEAGEIIQFKAIVRFDSPVDLTYYQNGGILPMVVRKKLASKEGT